MRWAGGRNAALAGEAVAAESRLLRYGGKALQGAKVVGRLAIVVSAGIAIGSAAYHLSQGEFGAAAVDVADFFTFGGTSYAQGKAKEAAKDINEGIKAYQEVKDWADAGWVPPPFREKETTEQKREKRFEERDKFLKSFGF
jgi:hypothetical protein